MLVHKHLIIRAEVERAPTDPEWTIQWFREVVEKIGMKVLMGPIASYVHVPGNKGLTAAVVIETSHMALHCWDEQSPNLIQWDIYTCGPFNTEVIFEELKQFGLRKLEWKYLDREHELLEVPLD